MLNTDRTSDNNANERQSEICPRCKLEPETVNYWLECPATCMKRQTVFGDIYMNVRHVQLQNHLTAAYTDS
jgi:hypothetical protein